MCCVAPEATEMNTDEDMDKPVTKRELHEALGLWAGALEARLEQKLEQKLEKLEHKLDAKVEAFATTINAKIDGWGLQLSLELKQRTDAILEAMSAIIGRIDGKYADLPGRMEQAERRLDKLEVRRTRRR